MSSLWSVDRCGIRSLSYNYAPAQLTTIGRAEGGRTERVRGGGGERKRDKGGNVKIRPQDAWLSVVSSSPSLISVESGAAVAMTVSLNDKTV